MTSATAKSNEPTIDDILASIRRIIADDQRAESAPAPAKIAVAEPGDDVLDLSQPVGRSAQAVRSADSMTPTPTAKPGSDAIVAAVRPRPVEVERPLPPKAAAASAGEKVTAEPAGTNAGARLERLIAGEAEDALAAAFGRISALKVSTETKTLDGLVADLLRPMLKEWLDANLPAIAERLVKQEIERIAAQSAR